MQSKPIDVQFDAKIRDEWVTVDGLAWADESGVYQTAIKAVWLDVVNVTGLLTDHDIAELDSMIPDAFISQE